MKSVSPKIAFRSQPLVLLGHACDLEQNASNRALGASHSRASLLDRGHASGARHEKRADFIRPGSSLAACHESSSSLACEGVGWEATTRSSQARCASPEAARRCAERDSDNSLSHKWYAAPGNQPGPA